MLSFLFLASLWSPAGKGLTSCLLFVLFNCVFVNFPCDIMGQVWYLIISILDLCRPSYFHYNFGLLDWYNTYKNAALTFHTLNVRNMHLNDL